MTTANRSASAFCAAIALLPLSLAGSCRTTAPDARGDLVRSLKGASVDGFDFGTNEDETEAIASLTNSAVRSPIRLDSATNLVLRYTAVRDKKTNTTRTYRTEVAKAGDALTVLVTDIASNEVVSKNAFPRPEPQTTAGSCGGGPTFASLQECIADFDCTRRGPLQCEANSTCNNKFAGLICSLNDGQCVSVHLIISPTTLRCRLGAFFPDLEGFVLSRR
jgi:hypothetical protein